MTIKDAGAFLGCSARTVQRYLNSGKLPYKMKGRRKDIKKRDLFKIANELHDKKAKHRPDSSDQPRVEVKKIEVPNPAQIAKFLEAPTQDLLNGNGKSVLKHTTQYVEGQGLADFTDPMTLMRYAFAVQMKEKYTEVALQGEEVKYWLDMAKMYQSEIQHYEKELGLTPASLGKIKLREKDEEVIDPMEALLSGN